MRIQALSGRVPLSQAVPGDVIRFSATAAVGVPAQEIPPGSFSEAFNSVLRQAALSANLAQQTHLRSDERHNRGRRSQVLIAQMFKDIPQPQAAIALSFLALRQRIVDRTPAWKRVMQYFMLDNALGKEFAALGINATHLKAVVQRVRDIGERARFHETRPLNELLAFTPLHVSNAQIPDPFAAIAQRLAS